MTLLEKLLRLSDRPGDPAECWEWVGPKNAYGYGRLGQPRASNRTRMAHRLMAEEVGETRIPRKYDVDHLCNNRACVNPRHLEVVSHAENMRRAAERRRCPHGHRYTEENTYFTPAGHRRCRECNRINARKQHARLFPKVLPEEAEAA